MTVKRVRTETAGNMWKILVKPGDRVSEGHVLMILESMKMEIPVVAPCDGTVVELLVEENVPVAEDEVVATIDSAS